VKISWPFRHIRGVLLTTGAFGHHGPLSVAVRSAMQEIIAWWCRFIGIADPGAILIATGVVGGGLALGIVLIVLEMGVALLNFMTGH
jgi:hypothetical protein